MKPNSKDTSISGENKMFLKLDEDGVVPPGTKIEEEEVIIGKVMDI